MYFEGDSLNNTNGIDLNVSDAQRQQLTIAA